MTGAASQYQEDLPPVRPLVRRFDIEVGHCSQCRRRVQGRHPLQTSDALGAARAQLGPGVVALVVELHTHGGMPLAKVADLLQTRFGLHVTPGGLSNLLHRAARDARPAYEELREQVRNAPVVTADETGWRVGAVGHWLWAAVTPTTTVYAICAGRGFDDAQTVLGADFDGVLVRDGWVVYRRYINGEHQSCLQHLLRRCEHLQEDHPHSGWAGQVQDTLQAGLALRDRRNAGGLSDHGLATARGRLLARLSRLIDNPPRLDDAERFAAHLAIEFPAIFTFLWDPSVDATNWRAEQAIRPAVVIRKVCGGNRTRKGADTQQVLASVVRTARQRNLDLPALFATMLRAALRFDADCGRGAVNTVAFMGRCLRAPEAYSEQHPRAPAGVCDAEVPRKQNFQRARKGALVPGRWALRERPRRRGGSQFPAASTASSRSLSGRTAPWIGTSRSTRRLRSWMAWSSAAAVSANSPPTPGMNMSAWISIRSAGR